MNPETTDSVLTWPKSTDRKRLEEYKFYDELYEGDHFEAFSVKIQNKNFGEAYNRLRYIVINFPGLMSRVLADMLFGENITIDFEDENNQKFVDALIRSNDLINQLYESALINSRRGFDVFKIRIGKRNPLTPDAAPEIIIEQVGADQYFPVFDTQAARNVVVQDVIASYMERGDKCYLHKEIHTPGRIDHEVYQYDRKSNTIIAQVNPEEFNIPPMELTKVDRSLVFAIPNYRDGEFWGPSDYKDLLSLFFGLNNRMTKIDNILDKHSDPILAVPPGVIDEEGKVKKEALGMFEVDNENPGFNKPEYIVWNANLESGFKEIEKLVDFLFMTSEIAPATMGEDKNGQAESGRALKFKLLSTIRKRNRKISYYDQAIKDILEVSIDLANKWSIKIDGIKPGPVETPKLKWGDGVINDQTEMVDISIKRVEGGLSTRADEIARLDSITPQEAQKKVEEIDKEQNPVVPVIQNNNVAVPPTGPTPPVNAPTGTPDQPSQGV